ncbi:hypothetical protein A7K91_24460 [Paenibacillus oryzae]|uniref:SLH domain-containing protein n=1 Tax=Paenibacillus oryzae TaxID=1844972 RepID=A0A1A5YLF5_9BACL|nr:S-layer homology domain-containing protein [Paenibacillus oryzae]OBR66373.1 hypothetical protein A7K91_24460 [Paenibacillus oryzae]
MKNKWLTIALALLLLLPALPQTLQAAADPAFYVHASKTAMNVGDQVDLVIGAQNADDWVAYELNVTFDPKLWTVTGSTYVTDLNGFSSIVNPELLSSGQLRAAFTKIGNDGGANGAIVLAKVKLTALAAGTGTITLNRIKIGQSNDSWTVFTPGQQANVALTNTVASTQPPLITGETNPKPDNGTEPVITSTAIQLRAKPNESGLASLKLTSAHLQNAVDVMTGNTLSVVMKPDSGVKTIELSIPLDIIQKAGAEKVRKVAIDSGSSTILLDRSLLTQGNPGNLQLSVSEVDQSTLPAAAQEKLKPGTKVYDMDVKLDGRSIGSFKKGEVTIEIPYTLQPGENPGKVVLYYVNEKGKLEVIKNAVYSVETGTLKLSPTYLKPNFPAYSDKSFTDLNEAAWAKPYIEALAAREAVNGVGNDLFNPNGQVTRAQFITMLVNLFDLADPTAAASFTDAKSGAWYYSAIASAQKLGIVNGNGNGTFGINDTISRQDMAVMLYRAAQAMELEWSKPATAASQFADQGSIADYALEAVSELQRHGAMNGKENDLFAPRDKSTRAQAAATLFRIFGLPE